MTVLKKDFIKFAKNYRKVTLRIIINYFKV